MKRHTVPWRKLAVLIPAALLGAAGGYFFMWALDPYGMTVLLPSLACLILSFWLQAILHEGGHLVCGLLSGYRFLSFRVGSFTLLRQNGRLVLRRFYLPGTGGQCLLEPPDGDEVPFRLYNLGGGLANLLSALAAALTPRTKAIILTSPNNPTGCVYTKETLDAVHAILQDKPIFVLCDDVYRTLTYCEDYHSFAEYQDMRDRIIVVQSFSKPYAMTGWRLGYCMADAKLMDRIQVFHQYCVTSVPSFVQRACVTALETDTSDVVEIFRRRRDYVYQRLVDMGLDVEKPEGAFYMFVDIRKFGMDSNTFCTRMLKEGLVGVIPGIHFGTEGFMRLSYCYSDADLKEGLDRIEKFIKSL